MTQRTLSELRQAPRPAADANFVHAEGFALMERMAAALAGSDLVPEEYRAESTNPQTRQTMKNPAAFSNCLMALCAARRLGLDPFSVMHGLRVTHGRPTWSAGLLLAGLQSCGRFTMPCIELAERTPAAERGPAERDAPDGRRKDAREERGEENGDREKSERSRDDADGGPDAADAEAPSTAKGMREDAPFAASEGAEQDAARDKTADAARPDKTATGGRHELCCTVRATEKATGRELTASAMLLRAQGEEPNNEPGESDQTALALRLRALLRFCRLYAPDLFPGLPDDAFGGEDAGEHPTPRASADHVGNAPRAKVTLEEIARQAKRSRETAESSAAKAASPEAPEARNATPKSESPGEDAMPQGSAAQISSARSDNDADKTAAHAGKKTPCMAETKSGNDRDDGRPTSAPGDETTMKKTKKEGATAKALQP